MEFDRFLCPLMQIFPYFKVSIFVKLFLFYKISDRWIRIKRSSLTLIPKNVIIFKIETIFDKRGEFNIMGDTADSLGPGGQAR